MDYSYLHPADAEKKNTKLYVKRVKKALPHFPAEVIIQWFFDHYPQINDYCWLDYRKFRFELVQWKTEQVPTENYGNVEYVETLRKNFASGRSREARGVKRMSEYFLANRTWPVPPIFLENKEGKLLIDNQCPCGTPYHLVEGHNRLAQFFEFKRLGALKEEHSVFIMKVSQ